MNPLFLLSALFIAYFFTRRLYKIGPRAFFSRFFGKEIASSPSFRVDMVLFALILLGISDMSLFFKNGFIDEVIGGWLRKFSFFRNLSEYPGMVSDTSSWYPLLLGCYSVFLVILKELGVYAQHRLVHCGKLWHIHKIHHSAERLGIFTFKRDHPLDWFSQSAFGLAPAAIIVPLNLALFGRMIDSKTLTIYVSIRIIYSAYGILNHSEVWLCFPNWLSHIFVSPAMHQIHHSQDEKHFNKNFSTIVSLWDWVFGTLYIPAKDEHLGLKFGLSGSDRPEPGSIRDCLIYPFRRILLGEGTKPTGASRKSATGPAPSGS